MSITYTNRTDNELYQGDILKDTIFHYLPPAILILREQKDYLEAFEIEDLSNAFETSEIIMARGEKGKVIIVSHHCDVHNKPIIQIAPIHPITKLPEDKQPMCRNNKMYNFFYLPLNENVGLEESYINFQLMSFYPTDLLDISKRIVSITEESINILHEKLLWYFTRKKLKEISPTLPLDES